MVCSGFVRKEEKFDGPGMNAQWNGMEGQKIRRGINLLFA